MKRATSSRTFPRRAWPRIAAEAFADGRLGVAGAIKVALAAQPGAPDAPLLIAFPRSQAFRVDEATDRLGLTDPRGGEEGRAA